MEYRYPVNSRILRGSQQRSKISLSIVRKKGFISFVLVTLFEYEMDTKYGRYIVLFFLRNHLPRVIQTWLGYHFRCHKEQQMVDSIEWVQCDRCQQWRKLPRHISKDSLPTEWFCEMNSWAPAYASCNVAQEEEATPQYAPEQQNLMRPTPRIVVKGPVSPVPPTLPHVSNVTVQSKSSPNPSTSSSSRMSPNPISSSTSPTLDSQQKYQQKFLTDEAPTLVKTAIAQLATCLQETTNFLNNYLDPVEQQPMLYEKLNEIISKIRLVSKSVTNRVPGQEKELDCVVYHELFDVIDSVRNNPSIYTERVLESITKQHERSENSTKRYKMLAEGITSKGDGIKMNGNEKV